MSNNPFLRRWGYIQQVKYNPNCPDYARYHHLPVEWTSYEEFRDYIIQDLGFPPKGKNYLNRIDQNKGWVSNNLQWSDGKERARNTLNANMFITYRSQTLTAKEWAEIFGMNYHTFLGRYKRGWSLYQIQTTPIETKFYSKKKKFAK